MALGWTMPHYRDPIWIELLIDDVLKRMDAFATEHIRNTPFDYWLLDSQGQAMTVFLAIMLCALVWIMALQYYTRFLHRVTPPASLRGVGPEIKEVRTSLAAQSNKIIPTPSTDDTRYMKTLAPPGHRPTSAHLNTSPYHLSRPLAKPTNTSATGPSPFTDQPGGRNISGSNTLGYEIPSAKPHKGSTFSSQPPSPTHSQGRNFSRLAKDVPVSYETLRETGMLDKDGSPTGKWAASKRMPDGMGMDGSSPEKKVVASDRIASKP